MNKIIFHTDKYHIPAFGLILHDLPDQTEIEFYNQRNGKSERYRVSDFMMRLNDMSSQSAEEHTM